MNVARIVPDWAMSHVYRREMPDGDHRSVWALAADRAPCLVRFGETHVFVARRTRNGFCRLHLHPTAFAGATVEQEGERHVVRLLHRDPGLTFQIASVGDRAQAEAIHGALVRLLDRLATASTASRAAA